jgi:hypothetical protein
MGSGIPVPPDIPEGSKAFILCVPDDPFFYGVVMGALKTMTFKYYWAGTDEEKTAVTDRMLTMYYDYQEQVGCMICDMVAECFADGNEALIEALAEAIRSNPLLQEAIADALTQQGSGVPGRPLTTGQATGNLLPDNVKDEFGNCIDNNLWGAMLYVVQSGNRVISDFFEVLEAASNTLESMTIISKAIPAAGDYISAAGEFADQLQENIAEGYAAAYTEAYEQSLACDMFCISRSGCELTLELMLTVINNRLTSPLDLGDFGEIMAGIASGVWTGDEIADVAFLLYFSALRFGQQFGDTIGIRPLPVIMSLGADQLSSDNWEILCECPEFWQQTFDFTIDEQGWEAFGAYATYVPATGWQQNTTGIVWITLDIPDSGREITAVRFETTAGNQLIAQVGTPGDCSAGGVFDQPAASFTDTTTSVDGATGFTSPVTEIAARIAVEGTTGVTGIITRLTVYGNGSNPF